MNNNGTEPKFKDATRPERTQIMTTKEIAKYLGVHEMTVYRWLKKGILPGFKIGDTYMVWGEGCDTFKIVDLVQYSPNRYGFLLDSGDTEEVAKCHWTPL